MSPVSASGLRVAGHPCDGHYPGADAFTVTTMPVGLDPVRLPPCRDHLDLSGQCVRPRSNLPPTDTLDLGGGVELGR